MENNDVQRSIGNIEGILQGVGTDIKDIKDAMGKLKTNFDDLEKGRLSAVEARVGYLFGIIAVCGVLLPLVTTFLMNKYLK